MLCGLWLKHLQGVDHTHDMSMPFSTTHWPGYVTWEVHGKPCSKDLRDNEQSKCTHAEFALFTHIGSYSSRSQIVSVIQERKLVLLRAGQLTGPSRIFLFRGCALKAGCGAWGCWCSRPFSCWWAALCLVSKAGDWASVRARASALGMLNCPVPNNTSGL